MSHLSEQLARYYERQGRRVQFRSGLTLNDVAHQMHGELSWRHKSRSEARQSPEGGADPSMLSRVLSGERLFTAEQLEVFCSLLALTRLETQACHEALAWDVVERYGMDPGLLESGFIDLARQGLHRVQELWTNGNALLALDWELDLERQVRDRTTGSKPTARREMLHILAMLVSERARIYTRVLEPYELKRRSLPLSAELVRLAPDDPSGEVQALADFTVANIHYNARDDDQSISAMYAALEHLTSPDLELAALRTIVVGLSHLGIEGQVASVGSRIRDQIASGSFLTLAQACEALEGLARAEAYLELPQALDTLEEAKGLCAQIQLTGAKAIDRAILLGRTECEALTAVTPGDREAIRTIAERTSELARSAGHTKHVKQLEVFLRDK